MRLRLSLLGSTGSIGRQTLEVVDAHADRFEVVALAARRESELLANQVARYRPRLVVVAEPTGQRDVSAPTVLDGPEGLVAAATLAEADIIVIALAGQAGVRPALAAAAAGKCIALANKESVVCAGELLMRTASEHGATIRPIDSEHSALWQCLDGEADGVPAPDWGRALVPGRFSPGRVSRLILTASGGPFRDWPPERLHQARPEHALRHPTWRMGRKITVDSATLMNKGLEVVEAHWLFGAPWDRIDVLLHPESLVHALVEFTDGSVKAQLGPTDMRLPIQYALSYPVRLPNADLPRLDLAAARSLTFCRPDPDRYPCFGLAVEAGRLGGTYPVVLAAADEVAVELFCEGRIRFTDIPALIRWALDAHRPILKPTLSDILSLYDETQTRVKEAVQCRRY